MIEILKLKSDEKSKVFNKKIQKMGPIMLDIQNHKNLMEAWEAQSEIEIEDFNSKRSCSIFL